MSPGGSQYLLSGERRFAAPFTPNEIVECVNPIEIAGTLPIEAGSISTDTRTLLPGQWFIAIAGENFDGHKFVRAAISRGAAGCLVQQWNHDVDLPNDAAILHVSDTLQAYHNLAALWRNKVNPRVIAVTGSSGKTTTKEMCAAVVSGKRFHKSDANENNEFGLPKTLLSMPEDTEILVAEMAMRGLGQIALLAQTASPDIGIITGVGTAHIELLGSRENIIKAKCELLEQLDTHAVGIIGDAEEALVERARAVFKGKLHLFASQNVEETQVTEEYTRFRVKGMAAEFQVEAHGLKHLQDAWCAVMAGSEAGLSPAEIQQGLRRYRSVTGRGNRCLLKSGALLIDESYNANPDSMRCAVEALLDQRAFPQEKKFVVMGEMAELGDDSEELHRATGHWLQDKTFTMLITVGSKAAVIAENAKSNQHEVRMLESQEQARELLRGLLDARSCVMIKGSHCANLDKLVLDLTQD